MHIKSAFLILLIISLMSCRQEKSGITTGKWSVSILPSSIRINPVTNAIIDNFHDQLNGDLLGRNWIYDGKEVSLHGARGEYVSFQVVISNDSDSILRDIDVKMTSFSGASSSITVEPELFLEWSVETKIKSTGYEKASLGTGWYPDALIPLELIQTGDTAIGRWTYPLMIPDFNNRINDQKSQIIWVDQWIPIENTDSGMYKSLITVIAGNDSVQIPVNLRVWNFALPVENKLKAGLQHEGFLSSKDEKRELETYQILRRNRIAVLEPIYEPGLNVSSDGDVSMKWEEFDKRLKKYFTGEAFTAEYGYNYGPCYGEPIEVYMLPFDVHGKSGRGWPDIGTPDIERNPENREVFVKAIRMYREHMKSMINDKKTEVTMYLGGLDESYFPEAWDRMVYYGEIFKKEYPEAKYRVDGGYSEEAMNVIKNSIDSWASHTINYDHATMRKYQEMGIEDWLYGPMVYESEVNSWVGSSTFLDLPVVNDRAISWATWKYKAHSWISWGIGAGWTHAWYDPETWKNAHSEESQYIFKKINGSALLLYSPGIVPNVTSVCPSIRLKQLRDGVEEYEYMRLLSAQDGNTDRADNIVNSIIGEPFGKNSIGNLEVWTYDAEKWDKARIELGNMINSSARNTK